MSETDRRKQVIEARETDLRRWADPAQLEAAWEARSRLAADFIAAGTRLLDIGCGAMALERYLPFGCSYRPCDLVARDARTVVADLNKQGIPAAQTAAADLVTMLGVWEYLYDPDAVFAAFAATGKPILCSYCATDLTPGLDRRSLGWVNDFSLQAFVDLAGRHGYRPAIVRQIDALQFLFKLVRSPVMPPAQRRRVHVVSCYDYGNFGDRLGFHLLSDLLPPHAEVSWGALTPLAPVPEGLDLLVVGLGNSLFGRLLGDQLVAATAKAKHSIGIFGTQFRPHLPTDKLSALLDRLTHWYARYEEDLLLYGRNRRNASHLGDWLIDGFAMTMAVDDGLLTVGDEVLQDQPLDRTIQLIQRHRRVHSTRLHPLLCALTSAEEVAYSEQPSPRNPAVVSGKFRSMLMDIFEQHYPAETPWRVDRDRVARYKARVRANSDRLRTHIATLLG